jgi:uncharacterized protein YkwD
MDGRAGVRPHRFLTALIAVALIPIATAVATADSRDLSVSHALPVRVASAEPRPTLELTLLTLVNQERTQRGLAALAPHAGLRAAARAHGQEMFAHGFLSHRSLDGRTPAQRVAGQQVRVRMVGENLAYAPDVWNAHTELMASEGHRQNILFPQFQAVGIAVLDGGAHGIIVVEKFSDPPVVLHGPSRPATQLLRAAQP